MSDPMITLVIPVHNRAAIVERTLQSVECQTARPLRVILVDNNSTDNTLQVLRRWKAAAEAPGRGKQLFLCPARQVRERGCHGLGAVVVLFVIFICKRTAIHCLPSSFRTCIDNLNGLSGQTLYAASAAVKPPTAIQFRASASNGS